MEDDRTIPVIETDKLIVRKSPLIPTHDETAGRGVFAKVPFKNGDVVEACPVIVEWHIKSAKKFHKSLWEYAFQWGGDDKASALVLGFGSVYNHSQDNPNMEAEVWNDEEIMVYYAIRDIEAGDELLFDYSGGDKSILDNLWFTNTIDPLKKKKEKK